MEDDLGKEDDAVDKEEGSSGGGKIDEASDIGINVGGGRAGQ